MRSFHTIIAFLLILIFCFSVLAFAGPKDWISSAKDWITGELFALLLTAAVGILAAFGKTKYVKIMKTFKEAGEFLKALGVALEDDKITKAEIRTLIKEGTEIFAVWT